MSDLKFKTILKEEREKRGLSQEKLAGMVGVSKETIRKVESGLSIPNVFLALALSKVLSISIEYLFEKLKEKKNN
ncbi:helix-turn-helix transcriptional regulator [Brevibacterium sp. PAMC21349]|nr:helix-turn-helix transcriptional regulator [Brevibacterium sp. PAMC21349]